MLPDSNVPDGKHPASRNISMFCVIVPTIGHTSRATNAYASLSEITTTLRLILYVGILDAIVTLLLAFGYVFTMSLSKKRRVDTECKVFQERGKILISFHVCRWKICD